MAAINPDYELASAVSGTGWYYKDKTFEYFDGAIGTLIAKSLPRFFSPYHKPKDFVYHAAGIVLHPLIATAAILNLGTRILWENLQIFTDFSNAGQHLKNIGTLTLAVIHTAFSMLINPIVELCAMVTRTGATIGHAVGLVKDEPAAAFNF